MCLEYLFYQEQVKGIARSLEALSYQGGWIEWKVCSGEAKTGEENRIVSDIEAQQVKDSDHFWNSRGWN